MALSDSIEAERLKTTGPKCFLCSTLERLGKDDRAVLDQALDNPLITSTQISRALFREGYEVRSHVIARHRRGECRGIG